MKNTYISVFKNYKRSKIPMTEITLWDWFNDSFWKNEVEFIRTVDSKEDRNRLKADLPCITPSGTFTERNVLGLKKHSGFMGIDIDAGDNPHLKDFAKVRDELKKLKNISYAGLSVSGKGVFCLIPIKYPDKHKEHFEALKKLFQGIGIIIDKSCGDLPRLRGYSYDSDAYFNENAIIFDQTFEYVEEKTNRVKKTLTLRTEKPQQKNFSPGNSTLSKVTNLINKINASGIDITDAYEKWFKIGCALANEFGEEGRELFHLVSENHPKYFFESCDEKFTTLLGKNYSFTIGTFFHLAEEHGFK